MIRFTSQHKTRSLEEPFLSQRSDLQAEGIRARYCIGTIAVDTILYCYTGPTCRPIVAKRDYLFLIVVILFVG